MTSNHGRILLSAIRIIMNETCVNRKPEEEPEAPEPEKPAQAAMPEPAEPERKPEAGKAAAVTPEEMKAMSVDGLRRLARELEIPSMTRAEIRYAKKQELIQKITEFIDS